MADEQTLWLQAKHVPDATCAECRMIAGGEPGAVVFQRSEWLLRMLSHAPPGKVSAGIEYHYDPGAGPADMQNRLTLSMFAQAHDQATQGTLSLLVAQTRLAQLYAFHRVKPPARDKSDINAVCDVLRREESRRPLVHPERNPAVPSSYLIPYDLVPNPDNDFTEVDRVLSDVSEEVTIRITLTPANTSSERAAFERYIERVYRINHQSYEASGSARPLELLGPAAGYSSVLAEEVQPPRMREPVAEDVLRLLRDYAPTLSMAAFEFSIRVFAQTPEVAQLVAGTVAECAFRNGSYRLVLTQRGESDFEDLLMQDGNLAVRPRATHGLILSEDSVRACRALARLGHLASWSDLQGVFRPMVASSSPLLCIPKNTDPPTPPPKEEQIILGNDDEPRGSGYGAVARGCARGIAPRTLTKHMFIGGVPGMGKTSLLIWILIQLFVLGVRSLCLAPIKTDFRALLRLTNLLDPAGRDLGGTLRYMTVGNETVFPYRQNSLTLQPGVSANAHIEALLSVVFPAVLPWSGPLPAIIGEALEIVYEQAASAGRPPILSDLVSAAEAVLRKRGYGPEVFGNLLGAIQSRLGRMTRRDSGRICQCYRNTLSVDELMRGWTVIEFDRLESEEEICMHVLTQLVMIRERIKTLPPHDGSLRLCIVIDEAHLIVGRDTSAKPSEDNPDPKAYVARCVCRILAELRALGVGVILADQTTGEVAPAVLAETATKVGLRQVSPSDREAMGNTMLLDPLSIEAMARLGPREAFFYTEGLYGPRRIRTADLPETVDLSPMSDDELRVLLQKRSWFIDSENDRVAGELELLRDQINAFDQRCRSIIRQVCALRREPVRIFRRHGGAARVTGRLAALARRALRLRGVLLDELSRFRWCPYRVLRPPEPLPEHIAPELHAYHRALLRRVEEAIVPMVHAAVKVLENLIACCRDSAEVGVGIMVAHHPLHGSQRAELPHWALASGDDAHATQWIRMAYVCRRQPQLDESSHPFPGNTGSLAASRQRALPEPPHPVPEHGQRPAIHGHAVVSDVPANDRSQPLPHRRNRVVPASPKLGFHLVQLRLQPLPHRLPKHRETPVPLLPADVREAEEVERLGLAPSAPSAVLVRERTELQQTRLLGVQLQVELAESLPQFAQEPLGLRFVLESNDEVVRVAHDDHVALRLRRSPPLDPQVERIVQVDVCQQRRSHASNNVAKRPITIETVISRESLRPRYGQGWRGQQG